MSNISFFNNYKDSTLKRYATNIPILLNYIEKYNSEYPNNTIQFNIQHESNSNNQISFYFQMEHTLVLENGRDLKGAKKGVIKSIHDNNKFYHVRIDNIDSFYKFNFIIEYSFPNIENITLSNAISKSFINKIIYVPPMLFLNNNSLLDYNIEHSNRNIDILTSYICVGNSKRREIFLNKLKNDEKIKNFKRENIKNTFNSDDLKKYYDNTKVIINIHQTEHHHTFEEFRVLPALMRGVIVISENVPCKDKIPYSNLIIWSTLDEISNTIYDVLDNYEVYFNNIFCSSNITSIFNNIYNDSYLKFKNKINQHVSLNCKKNIATQSIPTMPTISHNNSGTKLLFDFEKYLQSTKTMENEFKRLSAIEEKYNDLLEENKDLRKELKLLKNNKIPQSQHFSLSKSALDYGLDKVMRFKDGRHVFGHNFITSYTKLFDNYDIDDVDNVLEIGIGCLEKGQMGGPRGEIVKYGYKTGNSLRMWRDYFINANIHGIDIFKEAMIIDEDRIKTYVCNQSKPDELQQLVNNIGKDLNIIIDDGSHEIEHQVISFIELNKYLKKGGLYVIECIQHKSIIPIINLTAFKEHKEFIENNFEITKYDTRKDTNKSDDFMVVFKKL